MAKSTGYAAAIDLLDYCAQIASSALEQGQTLEIPDKIQAAINLLFVSKTQSYREVLLGCALIRLSDKSKNLSLPYINLGEGSYNGRSMDELVVNPFLQRNEIPSSKGPYLATFRRSVVFDELIRNSQKDKTSYDAFLVVLNYLKAIEGDELIETIVVLLIMKFIELRDASVVALAKIRRLHLTQYNFLINRLLETASGGLIPVLITVALLKTINACFELGWEVESQGINQSDAASGAGGDVTISKDGVVLCVLEVTERPIESTRVISTFNSKIVKAGISDYLFVYINKEPTEQTKKIAAQYFGQGHEINFVNIREWVLNNLVTVGSGCRERFITELLMSLDNKSVSSSIKVRWNQIIQEISSVKSDL